MVWATDEIPSIRVLGARVHTVEIPDIINLMDHWIETESDRFHHIVNTGMHGIMEGHRDPSFQAVLDSAELFAPDGILVLSVARLRGFPLRRKATGPDLMWQFGQLANQKGYRYFLYGDTEETLQLLSGKLKEAYPALKIVGCYSPPFRTLTPDEDESIVRIINESKPDVLWVGLGAPKQERWISEHRDKLNVPIAVGVGAAFKYSSGNAERAPVWLRNAGLEWLWRLLQEPSGVWRRVLIDAPQFIGLAILQLSGLKKYG